MEFHKVLFVIVLYKKALEETEAFRSLKPFVAAHGNPISLFIYDNSPIRKNFTTEVAFYVHDPSNPGVSRAYNVAFSYAKQHGFRFLLLMDQDTSFSEKVLQTYSSSVAKFPDIKVFAPVVRDNKSIFSPFRLRHGKGVPVHLTPGTHSFQTTCIVNSGMLISVDAFEKVGGFDESFPLDFSDIDFCERLANYNYHFCLIDASLDHCHSSSDNANAHSRFLGYMKAVSLFKRKSKKDISIWVALFPRAVKLSLVLRDSWFVRQFFKHT